MAPDLATALSQIGSTASKYIQIPDERGLSVQPPERAHITTVGNLTKLVS